MKPVDQLFERSTCFYSGRTWDTIHNKRKQDCMQQVLSWFDQRTTWYFTHRVFIIISVRNKIIISLISEHCNTCQLFCFVNGLYILISAFVELICLQTHNQQQEQRYCAWAVRESNYLFLILCRKTQHQTWSTSPIGMMTVECDCIFMPFYHWLWYIGHNLDYTI